MFPSRLMRNFSKFHWTGPAFSGFVSSEVQILVEVGRFVSVDVDLAEHREGDPVVRFAEFENILSGPWFLLAELVAWEAEHDEPFRPCTFRRALAAVRTAELLHTGWQH